MKKPVLLILSLILCLSLAGCGDSIKELGKELEDIGQVMDDAMDAVQKPNQEKQFKNNGTTLTLSTSFLDFTDTDKNVDGEYSFFYASDTIGIFAIEENKQELFDMFGEVDIQGYAKLIAQLYALDATPEQKDGFWYYTYETTANDVPQTFLCVFCETENAFWNLQSYCESSLYPENSEAMWDYLTSISFDAA